MRLSTTATSVHRLPVAAAVRIEGEAEHAVYVNFRARPTDQDLEILHMALCGRGEADSWRTPDEPPRPAADVQVLDGFSIAVMVVVDEPDMYGGEPFVDVGAYWPGTGRWTVTHCSRSDTAAVDREVNVRAWQPMLELPPPWSELWA